MIFITFHNGDIEYKILLQSILVFETDIAQQNLVHLSNGTSLAVDEDWEYFKGKIREVELATRQALSTELVMRKFNGEG